MESGYQVQSLADQALQQKLIKNRSIRIIPIESKWSAPSAWANAVMVWAALPQNWKKRSWLLSHYLYSWRICSGFRGEYFTLFCICSASGMTGTDVRTGSCRYLLNQQTLFICQNISLDNEFHIKKFWNFPMKMWNLPQMDWLSLHRILIILLQSSSQQINIQNIWQKYQFWRELQTGNNMEDQQRLLKTNAR